MGEGLNWNCINILAWLFMVATAASYYLNFVTRKKTGSVPPPGNRGYPVFGETFTLFTTPPEIFVKRRRKLYGDIFSSYLISNPTIVISSLEANKFFLEQDGAKFCNSSSLKPMRNTLGPHQVNQANGDLHRRFYRAILSHMLPEVLKGKVKLIDECANKTLCAVPKGTPVMMKLEIEKFTFLTIAALVCEELILDFRNPTTQNVFDDIRALSRGIISIPINIPFFIYYESLQARKRLISFFEKIIHERDSSKSNVHKDMLQTLLDSDENGRKLTIQEVIDNVIACLFAGHHTSAVTLTWTMKYLQENPKVLQDVKEEHERIAKKKEAEDYHLTWEDRQSMSFTWMVIQETLRLSNVPPAVIRELNEDIIYQGYRFPKGWNLIINFSALHLSEEHFSHPHTFDPHHFQSAPKRGTFTPFGAGNRTCAGRELSKLDMLVFIHRLSTKYTWEPVNTEDAISYRILPSVENYVVKLYDLNS